jgi:hypothetical protein
MSEEKNFVACPCQHCNGKIEFDANRFQTGTMATCPHCEMETTLFIPPISKPGEKQTEKIPEKTAKIVKQTTYSGGMEDTLEDVGDIFLFLGILGGIGAIIGAVFAFNNDQAGIGADLLCVGAGLIFASAINRILFKAGAEIVRLFKKLNGLKFSGKITQPNGSEDDIAPSSEKCSACGNIANKSSEKCTYCGARFEK